MIAALITAKDEAETIGHLVGALCSQGFDVCVCDDGSRDDTGVAALQAGARAVLWHDTPHGIGPSLVALWKLALTLPHLEAAVQLDAGGSHDPAQAVDLAAPVLSGKADVVIGSRFCPGGVYRGRPRRAQLSRLMARICDFIQTGAHHSDWTSGYRAFSPRALRVLSSRGYVARMHAWQMEVLAQAGAAGLRIAEVPIRYTAGTSSLRWAGVWEAVVTLGVIANNMGWCHGVRDGR